MKIEGSVVLRNLRDSRFFERASAGGAPPLSVSLSHDEVLVGWYRDSAPWEDQVVVFTDCGIYYGNGVAHRMLRFDEIVKYSLPRDKAQATVLAVVTALGVHLIRIAGRQPTPSSATDLFAVIAVLHSLGHPGVVEPVEG